MIELGFVLEHVENIDSKYDCILVVGEDFEKESYPSFCGGYLDVVQEAVKVNNHLFRTYAKFSEKWKPLQEPTVSFIENIACIKKNSVLKLYHVLISGFVWLSQ